MNILLIADNKLKDLKNKLLYDFKIIKNQLVIQKLVSSRFPTNNF